MGPRLAAAAVGEGEIEVKNMAHGREAGSKRLGRRRPRRTLAGRALLLLVPVALVVGLTAACGPIANVAQVAAGKFHTCALMTDGTVECWGLNDGGQLGDGTTANSTGPVEVVGLTGTVTAIVAGWDHTCVLIDGGVVKCWGHNEYGQLGDGTTTNRSTAVTATLLTGQVAAGNQSTCAVRSTDGTVRCWGRNNSGQIGDGTTTTRTSATLVSGITGATSVSVGNGTACAVFPAYAHAKCWGSNSHGEFGNNNTTSSTVPVDAFSAGSGSYAPQFVSVGNGHACFGFQSTAAVLCAGRNGDGQLGNGSTTDNYTPVAVLTNGSQLFSSYAGTARLTTGDNFSCAVDTGGHTACWGYNGGGELGNGGTASSSVAVDVPSVPSPSSFSSGYRHSCAVLAGATLKCWGENQAYQIGDGSHTFQATPVAPQAESLFGGVMGVSSGYFHSCALVSNGAQCFGYNGLGNLGNGSTTNSAEPVLVTGLASGVSAVSAGGQHSCALLTDSTVRCWGLGDSGQLGNGSTANSTTPVTVSGLSNVTAISAGSNYSCALVSDGTVRCWGNDGSGQLGNGEPRTNSSVPVTVSGITTATAISAGESHACALLADGTVECWGAAGWGQLGLDFSLLLHPPTYLAAPQNVVEYGVFSGNLTGATSVTAGADHTCAAVSGAGIQCWGRNDYGQLGDGTTTSETAPVNVSGSSGMTVVEAGAYHTCALSGSDVTCWGANYSGQLGDGTTTAQPTPQSAVVGGATGLSAGGSHTCTVQSGGHAKCWGRGEYGQLGNGSTTNPEPWPQWIYTAGYRWVTPNSPLN